MSEHAAKKDVCPHSIPFERFCGDCMSAEQRGDRECCWCGKVAPVAYNDVLNMDWCVGCYEDTFLENLTPDPTRVTRSTGADG